MSTSDVLAIVLAVVGVALIVAVPFVGAWALCSTAAHADEAELHRSDRW